MITAKQLRNTFPHRQMRGYIEQEYPQLTRMERGQKLAALTRKFLHNCRYIDQAPGGIDDAFVWEEAPEGHEFWEVINNAHPAVPKVRMAKAKPAPVVAKKKVGWW